MLEKSQPVMWIKIANILGFMFNVYWERSEAQCYFPQHDLPPYCHFCLDSVSAFALLDVLQPYLLYLVQVIFEYPRREIFSITFICGRWDILYMSNCPAIILQLSIAIYLIGLGQPIMGRSNTIIYIQMTKWIENEINIIWK